MKVKKYQRPKVSYYCPFKHLVVTVAPVNDSGSFISDDVCSAVSAVN
jgi:membrane-bound inhibitor of C-type lysozyme